MENQTTNKDQQAAPELTVTDLTNIRSILDVAVRRGTFGANEVSAVGATFDRLNNFLNSIAQQQKPEDKPQQ